MAKAKSKKQKKPAAKKKPVAKKKAAPPKKKAKPAPKKKPAAAKAKPVAKAKPAPKAKPVAKPTPAAAPATDWRGELRAAVEATGPDFAMYLAGLGASGWEFADSPELAGLEHWGTELAKQNRMAGIGALVRTAQHGFPIVLERGGIGLDGMGFKASEPSMDGAPVETQIANAAAWLDAPDQAHLDAVAAGNDPSRQLQAWDDDLRPSDDSAHWWYTEVGQCCGHAITRTKGDAAGHSYYEWPPETCVGRGLVVAVRGLRNKGASVPAILGIVRAALVA